MSQPRPFRFAVQEHRAPSAGAWKDKARQVESLGYSALYLPDHFTDQMGPIAALMAAADATTSLRVGSLVFDNDYRHPVVLAKEAATLDMLSDGRFDLGLGAGWLATDYEQAGIPFDGPGKRIGRLEEALQVIKGLFTGKPFSFTGEHYQVKDIEGSPLPVQKPHPPIVLGGGGPRMLRLAAREGDIVNVNFDLREGRVSRKLVRSGLAEATDEKLGWIREAAGDRIDTIELSVTIFLANITDDRESVATTMAAGFGTEPGDVLEMPHFLIGTVDELVDALKRRRDRYGVSFVIVPGDVAELFAPVVARLAGTCSGPAARVPAGALEPMRPDPCVRGPVPSSLRTCSARLAGPPLPSARTTWISNSLGRPSGRRSSCRLADDGCD